MEHQQRRAWIDLRKLRQERGWVQADTADKLGVTREHVSAIENGKRGISMQMMASIIQVFGVKYEDFYQTLPTSTQVLAVAQELTAAQEEPAAQEPAVAYKLTATQQPPTTQAPATQQPPTAKAPKATQEPKLTQDNQRKSR